MNKELRMQQKVYNNGLNNDDILEQIKNKLNFGNGLKNRPKTPIVVQTTTKQDNNDNLSRISKKSNQSQLEKKLFQLQNQPPQQFEQLSEQYKQTNQKKNSITNNGKNKDANHVQYPLESPEQTRKLQLKQQNQNRIRQLLLKKQVRANSEIRRWIQNENDPSQVQQQTEKELTEHNLNKLLKQIRQVENYSEKDSIARLSSIDLDTRISRKTKVTQCSHNPVPPPKIDKDFQKIFNCSNEQEQQFLENFLKKNQKYADHLNGQCICSLCTCGNCKCPYYNFKWDYSKLQTQYRQQYNHTKEFDENLPMISNDLYTGYLLKNTVDLQSQQRDAYQKREGEFAQLRKVVHQIPEYSFVGMTENQAKHFNFGPAQFMKNSPHPDIDIRNPLPYNIQSSYQYANSFPKVKNSIDVEADKILKQKIQYENNKSPFLNVDNQNLKSQYQELMQGQKFETLRQDDRIHRPSQKYPAKSNYCEETLKTLDTNLNNFISDNMKQYPQKGLKACKATTYLQEVMGDQYSPYKERYYKLK